VLRDQDLDDLERAAKAGSALGPKGVLHIVGEMRRMRRREQLHAALMADAERAIRFLEQDDHGPALSVALPKGPVSLRRLATYAGDGLWRWGLYDPERCEKDKPLDPPFMISRTTWR
jgi:hypothetical protein